MFYSIFPRMPEGFDGVESYNALRIRVRDTSKLRNPETYVEMRAAGVREIARLTGYSPAHVCYARRGARISRPLRRKMAELGLRFK